MKNLKFITFLLVFFAVNIANAQQFKNRTVKKMVHAAAQDFGYAEVEDSLVFFYDDPETDTEPNYVGFLASDKHCVGSKKRAINNAYANLHLVKGGLALTREEIMRLKKRKRNNGDLYTRHGNGRYYNLLICKVTQPKSKVELALK